MYVVNGFPLVKNFAVTLNLSRSSAASAPSWVTGSSQGSKSESSSLCSLPSFDSSAFFSGVQIRVVGSLGGVLGVQGLV